MKFIQTQLRCTRFVVPLITPAYLDSVFCQWELGAVWVRQGLSIFPIRVGSVEHSKLPSPLAQLQVAEFSRQGLHELAQQVSQVFGLDTPLHLLAVDDLLGQYPRLLREMELGWTSTAQAKLRRAARHAHASQHLHRVFHKQRDASFLLRLAKRPTPRVAHQFVEKLQEVTVDLATYFTEVADTDCRITLKQFLAKEDNNHFVQDIARSQGGLRAELDPIEGNTDFSKILRADQSYYRSNDLVLEIPNGYVNSHGVPGRTLSYRSTIVWPIRKRFSSHEVAAKVGAPLPDHDLLGFLCLDARIPNAFDEADFQIGAGVADSLYPTLLPYLAPAR